MYTDLRSGTNPLASLDCLNWRSCLGTSMTDTCNICFNVNSTHWDRTPPVRLFRKSTAAWVSLEANDEEKEEKRKEEEEVRSSGRQFIQAHQWGSMSAWAQVREAGISCRIDIARTPCIKTGIIWISLWIAVDHAELNKSDGKDSITCEGQINSSNKPNSLV